MQAKAAVNQYWKLVNVDCVGNFPWAAASGFSRPFPYHSKKGGAFQGV